MAAIVSLTSAVQANWLTRLAKEAGEAGGGGVRKGAAQLDEAASNLKKLPKVARAGAVAAAVSGEGHWTFINKAGQRFTAANDAEMARLGTFLFPDGVGPAGLNIYVTKDSVFKYRDALGQLPKDAKIWLADGKRAYRLRFGAGDDGKPALLGQIRQDLFVTVGRREIFDEIVWRLERPLKRASVRVLSLAKGGPASLRVVGQAATKHGSDFVEKIDPDHLAAALSALKGQTAVLTGRMTQDKLVYRSARGFEAELDLAAVRQAAAQNDVNLVLLNSPAPRQPGVRNWLWQTVGIDGLETALDSKTYGDFVGSLAGGGRKLKVQLAGTDAQRTVLSVMSMRDGFVAPGSETIGDVIAEVASEVAGSVVTTAIQLDVMSTERAKELDRRILPGIPSAWQLGFIGLLVIGLLGLPVAWRWWRWVWPGEERGEYGSWLGYQSAQMVRFVFFVLLFLPMVAVPAMIWNLTLQVWLWLTFPWRVMKWLFGSSQARSSA